MIEDTVQAKTVTGVCYSQCLCLVDSSVCICGWEQVYKGFVCSASVVNSFFFFIYPVCKTRVAHGTNSHEVSSKSLQSYSCASSCVLSPTRPVGIWLVISNPLVGRMRAVPEQLFLPTSPSCLIAPLFFQKSEIKLNMTSASCHGSYF